MKHTAFDPITHNKSYVVHISIHQDFSELLKTKKNLLFNLGKRKYLNTKVVPVEFQ